MPGRFPLFTDENVDGPLIKALTARGWDVLRAVDVFGERTDDAVLFAYAAENARRSKTSTMVLTTIRKLRMIS